MAKKISRTIRAYLVVLIVITCIFGAIYVSVQQNYRQSANDPQIQLSEDIARELSIGLIPLYPPYLQTNVQKSLSAFVIVYNEDLQVITSTADISNIQNPPKGVFDFAKTHEQNRLTWQPNSNLRLATVVTHFSGKTSGYVLATRSLLEVEKRVDQLTEYLAAAWMVTLFASFFAIFILV